MAITANSQYSRDVVSFVAPFFVVSGQSHTECGLKLSVKEAHSTVDINKLDRLAGLAEERGSDE